MSKADAFLKALKRGEKLTAKQAMQRFGFTRPESVAARASEFRFQGYPVHSSRHINSHGDVTYKYRLETPSRDVIAAGYRALSEGNA